MCRKILYLSVESSQPATTTCRQRLPLHSGDCKEWTIAAQHPTLSSIGTPAPGGVLRRGGQGRQRVILESLPPGPNELLDVVIDNSRRPRTNPIARPPTGANINAADIRPPTPCCVPAEVHCRWPSSGQPNRQHAARSTPLPILTHQDGTFSTKPSPTARCATRAASFSAHRPALRPASSSTRVRTGGRVSA